jgi:hypothetical protein
LCFERYWFTVAGSNMVILPLMLVGKFGLSPGEIGAVYAFQSVIRFDA